MQRLSACPVCQQTNFTAFLRCEDYTVSHETFSLEKCQACGFVMTNPQPEENDLPRYYQSDAYISHSNETHSIVDHLYKLARVYTLKWKYNLIQKYTTQKPATLLDFGCGTGTFLQECLKNGIEAEGVEPSELARTEAIRITNSPIKPALADVNRSFDVITLWHVLEHVTNLNDTLEQLKDRLVNNGTMFIAVPNLNSHDAKKYREHWAAYDVPRHLWHFTRQPMQTILKKHALTTHNVLPMKLDAFYVSLLSEKYKRGTNGFKNMGRALIQALKSNQAAKSSSEYSSLIYIVRK